MQENAAMEDADWKIFVDSLVEAKRCLGHGWQFSTAPMALRAGPSMR